MSQIKWAVNFDVKALMDTDFPRLYSEDDDKVWERWVEWVGYRRNSLKELVITKEVRYSLRARAVLARILPMEYLPFRWDEPRDGKSFGRYHHEPVPEVLQRLRYDVLCGFMEALPRSTLFDLSDHPVVTHLPRLNESLTSYLVPAENDTAWNWLDRERVFACYRLQSQVPESWKGLRGHFAALLELLSKGGARSGEHWAHWNERADARMKDLIEQELAGDAECTGALAGYASTVSTWIESTDEAPPPYDTELASRQMEYILDRHPALEEELHLPILAEYICYHGSSRPDLIDKGSHRYLISPSGLSSGEKRSRHWRELVNIAKAVASHSKDPELLIAARNILAEEEQIQQRVQQEGEPRKQLERVQAAEARRLLEEMM